MLFDVSPRLLKNRTPQIPGAVGLFAFGAVMGVISSFAGIGGAVLSSAFLMWCGLTMHHAIGTASAIGVPLAIAGTTGFIVTGLTDADLPAWSVGYVYLPAFVAIAATSMLLAPVGARLAHRLPVKKLKKIFVVFLILLALSMVVSV